MDTDVAGDASPLSRAPRALSWSFLNTAATRLGTMGIGIALARIVGPEEFGTYAVALIALTAALAFNELGVSLAIVRWPGDPRLIAPTVTTIALAASVAIAGLWCLLAPAFARAMGEPDATGVIQLLALSVVVSGAVATPAALLQREFRQDRKMLADQVSVWVGALTSIALAIGGWGAMSLAVGRLGGSAIGMLMFIRFSPEPFRLGIDRAQIRPLLAFGLPLAGASIIVFATTSVDQLIAGHMLGSTALGFYVLAFNLSSWPVAMFSLPLRGVAPATFARLQHEPESMRSAFRGLIGLLAAVTFPVCLLFAGAAEPLIRFVYGAAWAPAAGALTWLGVLAAFKIVFELAYDYLVVIGASRAILGLQLLTLAALVPAIVLGVHLSGIAGAAAAQVAVAACVALPLYAVLFRRAGMPARNLLGRLWLPGLGAVAVGACAAALPLAISSDVAAVVLAGIVAVAGLGLLVYLDRGELSRMRNLISPARGREVPA
jgi:PST family polysaccharide transporter